MIDDEKEQSTPETPADESNPSVGGSETPPEPEAS